MSTTRRIALILGIVFLLAGVAGFVPGLTEPHSHPDVMMTAGLGLLMGLFPVNLLHDLAHLLFGGWGLLASRSDGASRAYGKVVAISYALLAAMGLVTTMNLHTVFGFIPVYGHDVWLHAVLAAAGAYLGFMRPHEQPLRRA